jgi:uncharacterized protein with ATP-grasp and redox domains
MKVHLECYSCFLRIGLQAARIAGATEAQQEALMVKFLQILKESIQAESPLSVAQRIQTLVVEEMGHPDPYHAIKDQCNAEAENWLPHLRGEVSGAVDPLLVALKVAAIGNVMDYGAFSAFDVGSLIDRLHHACFAVDATSVFRDHLKRSRTLTYIADNAGEIIFDAVLIEHLLDRYPIDELRLVIRETPFLNDVSGEAHLPPLLRDHPRIRILRLSVVPSQRHPETWERITGSDLVLSKGMANFENYGEQPGFFSLLIAKCELVSQLISRQRECPVKTGDWVFMHNPDPG